MPPTRTSSRLHAVCGPLDDIASNGAKAAVSQLGQAMLQPKPSKPLKGRKRFAADLAELSANPSLVTTQSFREWSVRNVKAGDEEGSFEITLIHATEATKQTISLVVSDTSEYPQDHTFFGYSQDGGTLEPSIARAIDKLPQKAGHTLLQVIEFFIMTVSRIENEECDDDDQSDIDEDSDIDAMAIDEEDFDNSFRGVISRQSELSLLAFKRDFMGVKDAGYNPGIFWTESNRAILSVSLSVADLHQFIPPHALIAWDRHFLEPGQHLTLLISGLVGSYPVLQQDGTLQPDSLHLGTSLKFKVGFSKQYKPSAATAMAAFRQFIAPNIKKTEKPEIEGENESDSEMVDINIEQEPASFTRMTLSTSLESLLDQQLLRLLQYRRKFDISWAAAEELLWQVETLQEDPTSIFKRKRNDLNEADENEKKLSASYKLPKDPINSSDIEMNLMKIAFVFLLRRLALSTRHCVICHKKLGTDGSLRPYVCDSGLCTFQYYSLNMGPSIEHEIMSNTGTVDLLVSLAYVAAAENVLDEPFPRGMGLRVKPPPSQFIVIQEEDGLCNFDTLSEADMRFSIRVLLDSLPSVKDMKEYLQHQFSAGNMKARLKDMAPEVLPAAWSVLRWCVASCTAHIQEITNPEDRVRNICSKYRQFRFMVGAPDKEAKFQSSMPGGKHPSIFAFHGSPTRNWHSIIRHGLWFKTILHGRSYGNGVYFATDANVSLGSYAQPTIHVWKQSTIQITSCCTIAEIANRTDEFVHKDNGYYVVDKTEWIMCRYLLVKSNSNSDEPINVTTGSIWGPGSLQNDTIPSEEEPKVGQYLSQDPKRKITIGGVHVDVPQPSHQLDKLVQACIDERKVVITLEPEDRQVVDALEEPVKVIETKSASSKEMNMNGELLTRSEVAKATEPWTPDDEWSQRNATELLSPPTESSVTATMALRREFRSMMREQKKSEETDDLGMLGWYIPPQHNEDNLYQWLVELHSFDPDLPITKDMKSRGVSSIAMEIRFPPSFPHSPPFFRVIRPRFKPFMQGGGGHITVGGSVCMDLLTSDGWLPSYCISAVLLQIKLSISSTNPYPARLQDNWDQAYTPEEAYNGYVRAAGMHNWKIKNLNEIEKLVKRR